MGMLNYFFQKRRPELSLDRILQEQRMRFNPLKGFDPEKLVQAMDAWRIGSLDSLSRIIDELETRDDMMAGLSRKMRASVARCPHTILVVEGAEGDPRADEHRRILTRFWAGIEVTSAFARNERGGLRLLKKQAMAAVSRGYSCHEIVWRPLPDGSITAQFIHVPTWFFENRSGSLRFLPYAGALDGIDMPPGEWLVTAGDGIGIAASVLALAKVLSRNDWLLFSERCGQPGLHVQTSAAEGSPMWERLVAAAKSFGREWALVSDPDTKLTPVTLNTGGPLPYPPMIEMCNKGLAALYRGADLSTISGATGESTGASVQGDETDLLEQDACEMISETLAAQVERYVIRYVTGDDTPLAYISIAPSDRPNVDQDIKIDTHLAAMGVRLSRNDALSRYGRSEYDAADATDAPLTAPNSPQIPGSAPGFAPAGSYPSGTPLQNARTPLQNERPAADAPRDGSGRKAVQGNLEASAVEALSEARARDLAPVIDRLLDALGETDEAAMRERLASLLADLPKLAAAVGADADTDLVERILADAVGAGYQDAQGATP